MKRSLFCFLILLLVGSCSAQPQTDNIIVLGKTVTLFSNILHEKRQVMVYLPGSYYDTYFYKRRYPVVYALDGDSHFYSVAAMIKQLSENGGGLGFPEMILVSISNTDRIRDLTPSQDTAAFMMNKQAAGRTGGGEKFLAFIEHELIPHIDSLYPTAPYRVFIGHSLGGLMVIDALLHHPALFNAYLAIDPSMQWDNSRLLHEAQASLSATDFQGKSLFMATGYSLQHGLDTAAAFRQPTDMFATHLQSMFLLRNTLAGASSLNHLNFRWKFYPEYNHGTVPLPAEYDGLRFLFDFYRLDLQHEEITDPAYRDDTLLASHFADISRRMGYTVSPPEPLVNNIGYDLLGHHQFDRAYYYFDLNVHNYPLSFNVYDSMGDYWVARGEKRKAMECFKKALGLRENPETQQKLEKLSR